MNLIGWITERVERRIEFNKTVRLSVGEHLAASAGAADPVTKLQEASDGIWCARIIKDPREAALLALHREAVAALLTNIEKDR